ncbi:MAG: penicillin acylase family protein, partial [Candidatus Eremiobacteraeota bacterium]|nr:penicillin acylase family protein [Candidatus Eremiobacteraeota bacterium]
DADGFLLAALRDAVRTPAQPWSAAGAAPIRHAVASLGFHAFDNVDFPGDGDAYTVHVQTRGNAQSFRAVWDVGNWDAGGIVIPSGESGRPGSAHYRDLSADWIAQRLVPLPFSPGAVDAAARHRLELRP